MNLSSKNKPNPNFSMSSMTDLIFILLIFFLVTSSSSSIDFLPIDLPVSKNPQELPREDINIIITIKKDISCDSYQYGLNNGEVYCDWIDARVALNNFIEKINLNQEKRFSALILAAEESVPHGECVHIYDFASKYGYNIGVDVDKYIEEIF